MSRSNGILSTIQTNFDEKSLSVKLNSNQKRNIVKMLLSCFVLGTGTIFSIPLGDKVSIKKDEYSIESLTIDILKEYIWERKNNILKNLTNDASKLDLWHVDVEEVVNVSNESDIIQKLGGNKMKPNFLFSKYFIDEPPAGKIHIIIQPPATTGQGHTDISRVIATLGYLPRQGGLGGTMLPCDLKVSSTNEGVDINDPDVNPRFDIMPPLIRDLIDKRVILVRAPPFSGKTSIAQILEKTLVNAPEFLNCRVIRVSLLLELFVETFRHVCRKVSGFGIYNCRNPKSQTAAEIPNRCRSPKPLPKSQTVAEVPNRCRNPKPLPKSQTAAEIPNRCRSHKIFNYAINFPKVVRSYHCSFLYLVSSSRKFRSFSLIIACIQLKVLKIPSQSTVNISIISSLTLRSFGIPP